MARAAENEIVIRPEYDGTGRAVYSLPNARTRDNLVVVCPKVAEKVIPVIAGRITFSEILSLLATNVDHEGAYAVGDPGTENGLSAAMKFTLRSVIKMAGEVTVCG